MIQRKTSLPFYISFFHIQRMILKQYRYQKKKKTHRTKTFSYYKHVISFQPTVFILFQSTKFIFQSIFLEIVRNDWISIPRTNT